MIKKLLAIVLVALLSPAGAWAKTPREQALRITPGANVEVRLKTLETLRGQIGKVSEEDFELAQVQNGQSEIKKVAFAEVKSVHKVTNKKKVAVYTVVGLAALVGCFAFWATHAEINPFPGR